MRTIRTKVYSFDELSSEAKDKAIEQVRESYYEYNDFAEWAIDDCALFEPKHHELIELFGEDYGFPLIENTRKGIYFSTDRNWYLDCENAMVVTNDDYFLKWLGIDTDIEGLEDISYDIYTPRGRNEDTTIEFEDYDDKFEDVIDSAIEKFNDHINSVLNRIENDIEYRFTDEAIIEDIEANEYEFLKDGTRYL